MLARRFLVNTVRRGFVSRRRTIVTSSANVPVLSVEIRGSKPVTSLTPLYAVVREVERLYGPVKWFELAPVLQAYTLRSTMWLSFRDQESNHLVPSQGRIHSLETALGTTFVSPGGMPLEELSDYMTLQSSPDTIFGPYPELSFEERRQALAEIDQIQRDDLPLTSSTSHEAEPQVARESDGQREGGVENADKVRKTVSTIFEIKHLKEPRRTSPPNTGPSVGKPAYSHKLQRSVINGLLSWGGFASAPSSESNNTIPDRQRLHGASPDELQLLDVTQEFKTFLNLRSPNDDSSKRPTPPPNDVVHTS